MDNGRYQDLEHLLFTGFIPLKVRIGGVDFVFKSVNDIEYRQVELMSGVKEAPEYSYNFHLNYLFHSFYMVGGVNLLSDRIGVYRDICGILQEFPGPLIKMLFECLEGITKRVETCTRLVEPYSYDGISRYSWTSFKGMPLNSPSVTGIKGTDLLGINYFQKYWSFLNIREDEKAAFDSRYGLFKFLASFQDSKSVRKIDLSDRSREEEEQKRRERIRVTGTEEEKRYLSGPTDTAEGIVQELEKQMRGEKDAHDRAIETYERGLRAEMLRQALELKRIREERQNRDDFVLEQARPISAAEMAERIQRSKEASNRPVFVLPDDPDKYAQMSNVTEEEVLKEVRGASELQGGVLQSTGKGQSKEAVEAEYAKQQRRLAYQYGLDEGINEELDFPNLRGKR